MIKKILVVGVTSKIAKQFLLTKSSKCELYGTYNNNPLKKEKLLKGQFKLDLSSVTSINSFIDLVSDITFDGMIIFASTYVADPLTKNEMESRYQSDMFINVTSVAIIAKNINFQAGSKIVVLGDNGTSLPKKGYSSYTLSKLALDEVVKVLAVDLAPNVSTICIKLGPTLSNHHLLRNDHYYDKGLIKVKDPTRGLINFINFLINEPNFNTTGSVVNYDGGAYLRRNP